MIQHINSFCNYITLHPFKSTMMAATVVLADAAGTTTEFAQEFPTMTMGITISVIGAFCVLVMLIWKQAWQSQSKINDGIIDRLEKLSDKMDEDKQHLDEKIERIREEANNAILRQAEARQSERERLITENNDAHVIIKEFRDILPQLKLILNK